MLHVTSNIATFEERKQSHRTSAVTSSRPMLFKLLAHAYYQALKTLIKKDFLLFFLNFKNAA